MQEGLPAHAGPLIIRTSYESDFASMVNDLLFCWIGRILQDGKTRPIETAPRVAEHAATVEAIPFNTGTK